MDESSSLEQPCPFCGQMIKTGAVVCRFCHRDLFNPNAPPLVAVHDWERETLPERVIYTVRIPVSEGQWRLMCYGLSLVIGVFWIMLLVRPTGSRDEVIQTAVTTQPMGARPQPGATPLPPLEWAKPVETSSSQAKTSSPTPAADATPAPVNQNDAGTHSDGRVTLDNDNKNVPGMYATNGSPDSVVNRVMTRESTSFQANELIDFIDYNPDFAAQKVMNHVVEVKGEIVSRGQTADKHPFVSLRGTGDTNVQCEFEEGALPPEAIVGRVIRIKGTPVGRYVDVMMTGCHPSE